MIAFGHGSLAGNEDLTLGHLPEEEEVFISYCPISVFLSILGFDLYIHDRRRHTALLSPVLQPAPQYAT
jgi:hypothetical protein